MKEILTRLKAVDNLPRGEYHVNAFLSHYFIHSIETITNTVTIEDEFGIIDNIKLSEMPIEEQAFIFLSLYKYLR
jgi:hypothetical protein